MNVSARLAWRNLWRNPRRTWLTVGAMVFSNILLVFMISLQLGSYQLMIDNTLRLFTGHIQLQHPAYLETAKTRDTVHAITETSASLRDHLETNQVSARAISFVLASSEERSFGIQVTGVQPDFEHKVSNLPGLIVQGRYLQGTRTEEIVIGEVLARNLKVTIGDELTLLGSGLDGSFAAAVVKVVGVFSSGTAEIDRHMAQLPLGFFQSLFYMGNQGHHIAIRANLVEDVDLLTTTLEQFLKENQLDNKIAVRNWEALMPGLKQAIQADFTSAWFMYSILVVLVAFSVLNTQLMSVLERTREFGTMQALGVRPGTLSRLVVFETTLMAILGLLLGVLGGLLLTFYLNKVGFTYPGMEEMTEKFNLPGRIYPTVSFISVAMGPTVVFMGCLLASTYPALRLLFLKPIEAMRAV